MADNASGAQHNEAGATATPTTPPDHVSLRIITLAHGSNSERDLHLVLNLNSKVSELKESLQQHLDQHPQPDHQRLIYQGRPLLDGNATLQSVLRLDPSTSPPPVHVLHLVIREQQSTSTHPVPTNTTQISQLAPQPNNLPHMHQPGQPALPHPNLAGMNAGLQHMQARMTAMQQHMAIHNQNMANAHPGLPPAHMRNMLQLPGMPGTPVPLPGMGQPGIQAGTLPGTPNADTRPATPGTASIVNNLPHTTQTSVTTRIQEVIGPNGERIRTVVNTRGPIPTNHLIPPQANPVERSASAPGSAHSSESPRPASIANGQNMLPIPHLPPPIPVMPGHFARSMMNPFAMQTFPPPQLSQSTVWLLSSPTGPQALLFAPGHGYFSNLPSPQANSVEASQQSSTESQTVQPAPTQPVAQNLPMNNEANAPRAELVVHAGQGQNQAQVPARPQQREIEDIFGLLFQRGWLFLRLYMFVYVLSEAGTWRRFIMLSIATVVCLLPRQNPLTDAFNAIRRHVDALIGPPQAPQRQTPAQQPPQDQNATNVPGQAPASGVSTTRRSQAIPTPEEHARRLLREHQAQNPSLIRGILHSVEQAVALFLASLIPGVGERHVRAREEARRVVQEEEQRRREADANNAPAAGEEQSLRGADPSADPGTSPTPVSGESKSQEASGIGSNIPTSETTAGASTSIEPSSAVPSSSATSADAEGVRRRTDATTSSSASQDS